MSDYTGLLNWSKQSEDSAGEMWVCRAGWARGRDPSWTFGRWDGTITTRGLIGGAARAVSSWTAKTLDEAKVRLAEMYGPEVASMVAAVLEADEGVCRKCREFKPLKQKLQYDTGGICFVCANL